VICYLLSYFDFQINFQKKIEISGEGAELNDSAKKSDKFHRPKILDKVEPFKNISIHLIKGL
jgi:hypothetical protein